MLLGSRIVAQRVTEDDLRERFRAIDNGRSFWEHAEEVGYELATTAIVQEHLERHLAGLGVTAPVTHRWAGTMGFSPDSLPLVGRLRPGVSICAGYTGHGMGFAHLCARMLVDHLLGGPPPPRWLGPGRFEK